MTLPTSHDYFRFSHRQFFGCFFTNTRRGAHNNICFISQIMPKFVIIVWFAVTKIKQINIWNILN